ncbi:MAG: hypothetical protein WAN89_07425 [Lawsonella sp.]
MSRREEILAASSELTPATRDLPTPSTSNDASSPRVPRLSRWWQRATRRQRIKVLGALGAALLAGALFVFSGTHPNTVTVARTTVALTAGEAFADNIEWVSVPQQFVPDNADIEKIELSHALAVGDVAKGEILTRARLNRLQLPTGWRAVSMHSPTGAAASPGTHAEVVSSTADGKSRPRVLCENAVIQQVSADSTGSVIVAMPQQCAYKLAQLPENYSASLLLR